MDDTEIIGLYFQRSQAAIKESRTKYESYCRTISMNILRNRDDTEECLNDTWLKAWETIPPEYPGCLSAFFGRIIRNISLSLWRKKNSQKRKGSETDVCLEELTECIPEDKGKSFTEDLELKDALNRFLQGLDERSRKIFMKRYWYIIPVTRIAKELDMNEGAVKMSLLRTRKSSANFLRRRRFIYEKERKTYGTVGRG